MAAEGRITRAGCTSPPGGSNPGKNTGGNRKEVNTLPDKPSRELTAKLAKAREQLKQERIARKRAEDALRQSQEECYGLRSGLESVSDVVFAIAPDLTVLMASRAVERLLGYLPEELVGKKIPDLQLLPPEYVDKGVAEAVSVLTGRTVDISEYQIIAKDGTRKWGEVSGAPLYDANGRVIAVVCVARDITNRKIMEQQLYLAGRLAALGELVAGVAHELNNPLAAIEMYAQWLKEREDLDQMTKSDIETIHREAQRAGRITANLLSFARRHKPQKGSVLMNEILETCLELHSRYMRANNIEVVKDWATDLPVAMADAHQMQQVFLNIITNAEHAMTEAHGRGKLLLKTRRFGEMVQVTFTDDGPGIPEENLRRIFDPFFTTKDAGKGTGLGLSISFGIVREHGGHIGAESKPGRGTTFVVEIPVDADGLSPGPTGAVWAGDQDG